jgi:hypothetical protein
MNAMLQLSELHRLNQEHKLRQQKLWNLPEPAPIVIKGKVAKRPSIVLPEAGELENMLRHHTIGELSKILGFSRRAITTRLRRAGLGVGLLPKREPVLHVRPPQEYSAEPRQLPPDRVIRITSIGARVTMPRLNFLDGKGD